MYCSICGSTWHTNDNCPKKEDFTPELIPPERTEKARLQLVEKGFCPDCGSPAHEGPCR
jgi:hypothetical protein